MAGKVDFLREAVRLAEINVSNGGGPFGAVIVQNNQIIARGVNQVTLLHDPTAHAEVVAIRNASNILWDFNLSGCEIYSSCEPCPMCLGAIYWARIDRIYFAASKHDAANYGFNDLHIENEIKKAMSDRVMPMEMLTVPDALKPFEEWNKYSGRKPY